MAKVLTETPSFDPQVVVPEGLDSRSHAAEDVEALAQALTNRTRYLLDGLAAAGVGATAARLDQANIFTAAQNTFKQIILAASGVDQGLHINAVTAGSQWAHVAAFRFDGSHQAHVYLGTAWDTEGALVVCWNSYWDAPASLWRKHAGGAAATAVVWFNARISFSVCNLASWAKWPDRARTLTLPMSSAVYDPTVVTFYPTIDMIATTPAGAVGVVSFALPLGKGCQLTKIEFMHKQNDSSTPKLDRFTLQKKTQVYADNAASTVTKLVDSQADIRTGNPLYSPWTPGSAGAWTVGDNEAWALLVDLPQGNELRAVRVQYTDPGII